jgi:hypothetical protein
MTPAFTVVRRRIVADNLYAVLNPAYDDHALRRQRLGIGPRPSLFKPVAFIGLCMAFVAVMGWVVPPMIQGVR